MFDNSGKTLKSIVLFFFVLSILSAVITLIAFTIMGHPLYGLLIAVISGISSWLGALIMSALADAAADAAEASYYASEALHRSDRILQILRNNGMDPLPNAEPDKPAPVTPKVIETNIPTWKKVQIEKEQNENQQ